MLAEYYIKLAKAEFAKNNERRAGIKTPQQVRQRQREIRRAITEVIGEFPARTPLRPRVVGRIERKGYAIEKVIFESRPRLYVTASLYLPDRDDWEFTVPGILSPCGHSADARFQASETYQGLYISLVRNGYAVLVYDPVGQGERFQSWDPETKKFLTPPSCAEHDAVGHQCVLTGTNLAQYRIWDGMRAIDYLQSRPEVDKSKIGCTGCSGGGTLTAYLTALDDRILVSIPNCYITSFEALFTLSSGGQDAEQCFTEMLTRGIDHVELLLPHAPQPLQISAAIRDFFPISGARSTFRELKRMYQILGAEERISMAEDDCPHDYSPNLRNQAIPWFNRWMGKGDPVPDPVVDMIKRQSMLWCTKTGQVLTSIPGAKTVFDFNREYAQRITPPKAKIGTAAAYKKYRAKMLRRIKRVLGYQKVDAPLRPRILERTERRNLVIEKVSIQSEPGIRLPALLMMPPDQEINKIVLLISDQGKDHKETQAKARTLLSEGSAVLAVGVRYFGGAFSEEEKSRWRRTEFVDKLGHGYYDAFVHGSWMLGKPLPGMMVTDALRVVDYVRSRADLKCARVAMHGIGDGALIALYAAALDRRIKEVRCEGMLISYQSLVMNKFYNWHPRIFLPGVIGEFDLDDVAALVAPRPLALVSPLDERRNKVSPRQARSAFATTTAAYRLLKGHALRFED